MSFQKGKRFYRSLFDFLKRNPQKCNTRHQPELKDSDINVAYCTKEKAEEQCNTFFATRTDKKTCNEGVMDEFKVHQLNESKGIFVEDKKGKMHIYD